MSEYNNNIITGAAVDLINNNNNNNLNNTIQTTIHGYNTWPYWYSGNIAVGDSISTVKINNNDDENISKTKLSKEPLNKILLQNFSYDFLLSLFENTLTSPEGTSELDEQKRIDAINILIYKADSNFDVLELEKLCETLINKELLKYEHLLYLVSFSENKNFSTNFYYNVLNNNINNINYSILQNIPDRVIEYIFQNNKNKKLILSVINSNIRLFMRFFNYASPDEFNNKKNPNYNTMFSVLNNYCNYVLYINCDADKKFISNLEYCINKFDIDDSAFWNRISAIHFSEDFIMKHAAQLNFDNEELKNRHFQKTELELYKQLKE